jgi:hypothetical protein
MARGANCNKTAALTVYGHKRLVLGIHGDIIAFKLKAGLARSLGNGSLNDPMHFGRLVGGTVTVYPRFLSNSQGGRLRIQGQSSKTVSYVSSPFGVGSCGVEQNRSSGRQPGNGKHRGAQPSGVSTVSFARRSTVAHRSGRHHERGGCQVSPGLPKPRIAEWESAHGTSARCRGWLTGIGTAGVAGILSSEGISSGSTAGSRRRISAGRNSSQK